MPALFRRPRRAFLGDAGGSTTKHSCSTHGPLLTTTQVPMTKASAKQQQQKHINKQQLPNSGGKASAAAAPAAVPVAVSKPPSSPEKVDVTVTSRKRSRTDKQGRRRIAFSSNVSVVTIVATIHISDYSIKEKSDTWYSATELKAFKMDRKETMYRMEHGELTDTETYCTRGVEPYVGEGARQRHKFITRGIDSVLDEQEEQEADGKDNPEMLATIYRSQTWKSAAAAHTRGVQDAAAAAAATTMTAGGQ